MNHKPKLIGGFVAFVLATSCCWLPALAVLIGGATGLVGLSEGLEKYSGLLMAAGFVLVGIGGYEYYRKRQSNNSDTMTVLLKSTITCPECGHKKEETMPTNACQFFYDWEKCKAVLKPKKGDCCV